MRPTPSPCVPGEIKRHFRGKRWQVRVRQSAQELWLEMRSGTAELTQKLARSPGTASWPSICTSPRVTSGRSSAPTGSSRLRPWTHPVGDDGQSVSIGDLMGADDPAIEQAVDVASVCTHWQEPPGREQRLLAMRFYGNMTQTQIGEQAGLSQMHVSRLLTRALTYLRECTNGTAARPCAQG